METRKWTNPSQPQTLQIAVFLLYINAAFGLLGVLLGGGLGPIGVLLVAGGVAAGYGIANEQRWAYGLGVAMALAPFALRLAFNGAGGIVGGSVVNLLFEIALVALLLHPQSRDYQRIWFH